MKKSELRFILGQLQERLEALENEQVFTDAVVEALAERVAKLEAKQLDGALTQAGRESGREAIIASRVYDLVRAHMDEQVNLTRSLEAHHERLAQRLTELERRLVDPSTLSWTLTPRL
jgi:ubiquinone biosynthesis protein UbiJ